MHVNDQYYEKVNHITKHLTLAKQHSASFYSSGTMCKMRSAVHSVEKVNHTTKHLTLAKQCTVP